MAHDINESNTSNSCANQMTRTLFFIDEFALNRC